MGAVARPLRLLVAGVPRVRLHPSAGIERSSSLLGPSLGLVGSLKDTVGFVVFVGFAAAEAAGVAM